MFAKSTEEERAQQTFSYSKGTIKVSVLHYLSFERFILKCSKELAQC
jgi:hypothetical protein